MLEEIRVDGLLILETAHLEFHPGFNVVSGETGVGKSLLLSAIDVLFGGKLESEPPAGGVTRVEGRFALRDPSILPEGLLEEGEVADELVIRIEKRDGKGQRASLDGRIISRAELARLATRLVDVHGQRDLQRLLSEREQVAVLDAFGRTTELATRFATLETELRRVRTRLERRAELEDEIGARLEVARFQCDELEEAAPRAGEAAELARRVRARRSAHDAAAAMAAVADALEEPSEGPIDRLRKLAGRLDGAVRDDEELGAAAERLYGVVESLGDLARELADAAGARADDDEDPAELERRLDLLNALMRKHRCDEDGLASRAAELRAQVDELEGKRSELSGLERQAARLAGERREVGLELARRRDEAGRRLASAVEAELADLRMEKARFAVASGLEEAERDEPDAATTLGFGRPRFRVRTNPGQDFADLADSASGGELSRVLLALKSVLAETHGMPLLIFDEIESGVGPRLADVLGRRLARLARHRQVLCITHYPQIAAFADRHFQVAKAVEGERTVARIEEIEGDRRLDELATMLGGGDAALSRRQAASLLERARDGSAAAAGGS